jgi:hypothetical protein
MKRGFVLAAMIVAACSEGVPTAPLDREFKIAIGERVSIAGTNLIVGFVRVPQDNRCPLGALCVQSLGAGNAQVQLSVTSDGAPATVILNTTVGPQFADVGSYVIALSLLTPYPGIGHAITESEYRATLAVEAR